MTKSLFLAGVTALVLASAGCTSVNTMENAEKRGQRTMIADSRVITDMTLNKRVNLVGVNTKELPNGLLKIQVEVVNNTNSIQGFYSTLEWFDLDGMKVSTAGGGWTERQIMPRESLMIVAVAPSPQCKDFRLKLMEDPR